MKTVILQSERLFLRHAEPDDALDFFALDRDPEVMRHIGDGVVTTDIERTKAGLARVIAAYASRPGLGLWACCRRRDEHCLGWFQLKPCLLAPIADGDPASGAELPATEHIEIGYRLRRDAWGQGYATEMARALIAYAFERAGLERVVAVCRPANSASIRVMLKAGLARCGPGFYQGTLVEVYAAEKATWRPAQAV